MENAGTYGSTIKCPNCGRLAEPGLNFCAACGTMLNKPAGVGTASRTRTCMTCGRTIPSEYNICPYCGSGSAFNPQPYIRQPLGNFKYAAYIIGFLIPIVGVIWGIIWAIDKDPEKKSAGQITIIISILGWVFNFVLLSALLY